DVKKDNGFLYGFEPVKIIDNPLLRSGLCFAGVGNNKSNREFNPTGEDNGFLTAYEAMNLDLENTELVVLSACETGSGDKKNGAGVFGLRQAFQQAGAKTVIMSLWADFDEATQELMSKFYSNWVSGKTKRESFNLAQQEIRKKYKEPYYWGAFVMVGE
ncbi:MAG: CHAT domain-containing protein, partial [FCB group bacterium]